MYFRALVRNTVSHPWVVAQRQSSSPNTNSPRTSRALYSPHLSSPITSRNTFYIFAPTFRHTSRLAMPRRGSNIYSIFPRAMATPAIASSQTSSNLWSVLVQAYYSDPVGVLLGVAVSIAAVALSAVVIAAIPALLALRRSVQSAEALLHALREELPDTIAALRLSGLEVADAVQEVSALGSDLTQGVRASARALVDAEQGMRQSIDLATHAVTGYAIPALKKALPSTKSKVEDALRERSGLETEKSLRETAGATKRVVRRLRTALGVAGVAGLAVDAIKKRSGGGLQSISNQNVTIDPYARPEAGESESNGSTQ